MKKSSVHKLTCGLIFGFMHLSHLCRVSSLQWFFQVFWIGACAIAMLFTTAFLIGGDMLPPVWLTGYVFCATTFAYNYAASGWRRLLAWMMCACAVGFFLKINIDQQRATLAPALLWLLYYDYHGIGTGFRQHPAAKPVAIALAWAIATVWIPILPECRPGLGLLFIGRAAFVFALALAYDLCDQEYDLHRGLTTLVLRSGPRNSRRLCDAALLLAAGCALGNVLRGVFDWPQALALSATLCTAAWAIRYIPAQVQWGPWRKVAIDGLMILQTTLVWLATR